MTRAHTPFGAVFRTEVLLNSKRAAPYVMAALFAGNAWLWAIKGKAAFYGWAANSDYFITHCFFGFTFMTLPLFTALLMGDPVARDFRAGVAPLVFSKPVGRASYLSAKFLGNFFVLVCCQSAFAATLILLQWFPAPRGAALPARLAPYVKHFLLLVVVSHLALAAFHFTVGTLTRSPKLVYGLAALLYPLYAAYQIVFLRALPPRWRAALDPLLMNWGSASTGGRPPESLGAEAVNRLALDYGADALANRAAAVLFAAGCLAFLYARFSTVEPATKGGGLTTIGLASGDERIHAGATDRGTLAASGRFDAVAGGFDATRGAAGPAGVAASKPVALPRVSALTGGARAGLRQLAAATAVELRLLSAERSLYVLLPLATLAPVLELAYYAPAPDPSYPAVYAARAAESLLLFLVAVAIFYTGEGLHRERELRVEPVVWAAPVPNSALLLPKFLTPLLLSVALVALVGTAAVALQIYKGHAPAGVLTHAAVYCVVLLPGAAFMVAAVTLLNVLLRDKHLAHAVSLAVAGALFYLFNLGYNHWLYNPVLHGLWSPADFAGWSQARPRLLTHRLYTLALAALCLALAHLFHGRGSSRGARGGGRMGGRAWAAVAAAAAVAVAVVTGLMVGAGA